MPQGIGVDWASEIKFWKENEQKRDRQNSRTKIENNIVPLSMVTRGKNLLRITFSISLGLLAAALFFAVVASLNDHLENFWVNVVQMFGLGLVVSAFAFLPPLLVGSVALTWVPKRPLVLGTFTAFVCDCNNRFFSLGLYLP